MKNLITKALCALCLLAAIFVTASCDPKGDIIIDDAKTINVRAYAAGWGAEWLYNLAEAFEEAYADEGYKVNILKPSSDNRGTKMLQEMYRGYNSTKIDLFFIGDCTVETVGANGDYGVIAEDIYDCVYMQKAINYDGEEEELTVLEKLNQDYIPYIQDSTGTYYGFTKSQAVAGLVVNTRKLLKYYPHVLDNTDEFGYHLPRTTDELFRMFEEIYLGTNGIPCSAESTTYPVTYLLGNNNGYCQCAFEVWLAQMIGVDGYNTFWSFDQTNQEGEKVSLNGYEVYCNTTELVDVYECAYRTMDACICANGSTTQGLDQAQAKIMKDGDDAIFMFNGDWMLNEVSGNYKKQLEDITFINMPVISALGTQMFGAGTTANLSDEQCDALLTMVCGLVDQNKTKEEIKAAVSTAYSITLSDEEVDRLCEARGVNYGRGVEEMYYMCKGTSKKEIASLFLRMMASDDFGEDYIVSANGTTPFVKSVSAQSQYTFCNAAKAISTNAYKRVIRNVTNGTRKAAKMSTFFPKDSYLAGTLSNSITSKFTFEGTLDAKKDDSIYRTAAEDLYTLCKANAFDQWKLYVPAL